MSTVQYYNFNKLSIDIQLFILCLPVSSKESPLKYEKLLSTLEKMLGDFKRHSITFINLLLQCSGASTLEVAQDKDFVEAAKQLTDDIFSLVSSCYLHYHIL